MLKYVPEILCSIGVAILVAGIITFIWGFQFSQGSSYDFSSVTLNGVRVLARNICLSGGILAVVGSGLTVFGFLLMRSRNSN